MQESYRILIIEDDVQSLEVIREALAGLGPGLVIAEEASEGVERALKEPPELFLINLAARGTGGLDVCKRIHGNASTEGVPIILLTLREGRFDPVYTKLYGIVGFISKPLSRETLLMGLSTHVPPEIISVLERTSSPIAEADALSKLSGQVLGSQERHASEIGVSPGQEEVTSWNLDGSAFGQPMEELAQEALERQDEPAIGSDPELEMQDIEIKTLGNLSDVEISVGATAEDVLETHRLQEKTETQLFSWEGAEEESLGSHGLESHHVDEGASHSVPPEEPPLDEAAIERAIEEYPEPMGEEAVHEKSIIGPDQMETLPDDDQEAVKPESRSFDAPADTGMTLDDTVLQDVKREASDDIAASSVMDSNMTSDRMEAAMALARARRYQSKRPRYRPRRKKPSGSRALLLPVLLLVVGVVAAGSYLFLSGYAMELPWKLPWIAEQTASSSPHKEEAVVPEVPQQIEASAQETPAIRPVMEPPEPDLKTSTPSSPSSPVPEAEHNSSVPGADSSTLVMLPVERAGHYIQFGMFSSEGNANRLVRELKEDGYNTTVRRDRFGSGRVAYRVVLNRTFISTKEAENKAQAIQRDSGRKTYVYSE